ncbi:MAG: PH domain-containing protein [Xanthobacteraceae bacterium]
MNYVQSVLQTGEEIRYSSGIHWIVYVRGIGIGILACIALIWASRLQPGGARLVLDWIAAVLGVVAMLWLAWDWFLWWITEIAATNRRVIYKKGFIWRDTNEMNLDKVESVQIKQSILGRLFDYGDITIIGTGEGRFKEVKMITGPIQLRNHIMGS